MTTKQKNRHLSFTDYFIQLQLEYICSELRSKIYPSSSDKKYYRKLMEQKKEKILNFKVRNNLPTIFDDSSLYQKLCKEIYNPDGGLPNFLYRDESHKEQFKEQDIKNYYSLNQEVKTKSGILGLILSVNIPANLVEIKNKEGEFVGVFYMNEVTRIL